MLRSKEAFHPPWFLLDHAQYHISTVPCTSFSCKGPLLLIFHLALCSFLTVFVVTHRGVWYMMIPDVHMSAKAGCVVQGTELLHLATEHLLLPSPMAAVSCIQFCETQELSVSRAG